LVIGVEIVCSGGTYVRKLVVDIAIALKCCATAIALQRTAQGPFTLEHCLHEDQWNVESIQTAIEKLETILNNYKKTRSLLSSVGGNPSKIG
jgi:tRNA U55 pseudouridine synthase TruB